MKSSNRVSNTSTCRNNPIDLPSPLAMQTKLFNFLSACVSTVLVTQVSAIEAPVDDAAPPAAVAGEGSREIKPADPTAKPIEMPEAKLAEKVETAFLGVGTTVIPEILAEHLNLNPDEGVLVNSLQPDSPAAKAGIAVNDIITRVAGERVASALDLGEKIRAHKPGETIHLDVIHKGKSAGLDIALGSRPQAPDEMPDVQALDGIPKEMQDRIRDMKNRIGAMELKLGGLRADAGIVPGVPGMGKIEIHNGGALRMMDPNGSVELKSNDDGKEITIRDHNDKVTWSGPWDTEQDKAAAPADVRQRIERLNIDTRVNGNGFRLNMGGVMPEPEVDGGDE
jgi:serine protease Do